MAIQEMTDSGRDLYQGDMDQLERKLKHPIPYEYRQFLLKYNGGRPVPDVFVYVRDGVKELGIISFFLEIDGEFCNLHKTIDTLAGRMPEHIIPIADDPGGNAICLSLTGDDAGKLYFWDHDEEADEGEIADYRNLYWIADDLDSFLDSLFSDEEVPDWEEREAGR